MNTIKSLLSILFVAAVAVAFTSCDKSSDPVPVDSKTVSNLNADAGTGRGSQGEIIGATGHFTFFSFATGSTVSLSDSATNKWDLGFRGTNIIVNSATSGPGSSKVQIINGIFDQLNEAPADGYISDNDPAPINPAPNTTLAIPTGSGKGWYTYDAANFVIKPTAGKVIVVKTADGRYAKVEIISYYKNAPTTLNYQTDIDRYYTFRYVYQPNDSRSFQ
jgi:hypothetical protein